ncbi:50S ribosomal protein L33 [bacterium]|nr:50S ribosomal protein L33 [bacterium]
MRDIITLECGKCKRRNYTTTKNKKLNPDRMLIKKYCRFCREHTEHKEIKK